MAVPEFTAMVSPMDPQPTDVSTTHGFCSVADIKAVFKSVHKVLVAHDDHIADLTGDVTGPLLTAMADLTRQYTVLEERLQATDRLLADAIQTISALNARITALEP